MTLPSDDEAHALFAAVNLDPRVVRHQETVVALADELVPVFASRGHEVDAAFVHVAALVHDVGRARTHSVAHGVEGARMLRAHGWPEEVALAVERHVGAGIPAAEARELGIAEHDLVPVTLEERLVAHADNLVDGAQRKKVGHELEDLKRWGLEAAASRVAQLHAELSALAGHDLDRFVE